MAVGRRLDHAELIRLRERRADAGDRHARAPFDMALDHLCRVDPVDVIGAEHTHVVGPFVVDQVQALVDRIGGACEPLRPEPLLRRDRRHVVPQQRRQPPHARHVPVEAVALVLSEDDDAEVAGVDEIREREVDEPVVAAERHRGLRPVGGEGQQALALAAREHKSEHRRTSRPHVRPRLTDRTPLSNRLRNPDCFLLGTSRTVWVVSRSCAAAGWP